MSAESSQPTATEPCTRPTCKGHHRYVGGIMDGEITHLVYAAPSDYPQTMGTLLRSGQRSWYELDYERSEGTEAVYRAVGVGETWEEAVSRARYH